MDKDDFFRCIELRKRLVDRVKGKVFIGINNGQLTICITGLRGIRFTKYYNDIPDWVDYNRVVDEITYEYKQFILDKFIFLERRYYG